MTFRILHLSHLHQYQITDLLKFLMENKRQGFQAMVLSGFSETDVATQIEISFKNLERLSHTLALEPHQVLCLPEPIDCQYKLSIFNNAFFYPFFGKAYNILNQALVTEESYQILGLPDHFIPGYNGINQDMFELKVRQADRVNKNALVRLYFCGNDPKNWHERPRFMDPTHFHHPVILHGNGVAIGPEDNYFGIGANSDCFNVIELNGMLIQGQQFKKAGSSWVLHTEIQHTVRSMAWQ